MKKTPFYTEKKKIYFHANGISETDFFWAYEREFYGDEVSNMMHHLTGNKKHEGDSCRAGDGLRLRISSREIIIISNCPLVGLKCEKHIVVQNMLNPLNTEALLAYVTFNSNLTAKKALSAK